MKFTLSWLKDHLETSWALDDILETLTKIGLEVESVSNPADALKGFKVAHILEANPHPDADRLQVCKVDCGQSETLQIVCGAPNARQGIKVVLGLPGSYVPALDFTLKETKIRGIESFGMMCSAKELGLGEEQDGILELDATATVGQEFSSHQGMDDPLIEVGLTPNRPDCLGVRGIARDLAAAGAGTLKEMNTPNVKGSFKSALPLELDKKAQKACPNYLGREIKGIQNKPSPEWLQRKLRSVGLKSISALVDITNYISFDLCRPLHVFDKSSLKGSVSIRLAKPDESFLALDEKEYTLDSDMVVISDQEKVLALGGVMGGLDSGCTLETETVLLESAYFDPSVVAMAGRRLNLLSDARYRFERGIDPLSARMGIEKATQLILEICGGEPSEVIELGEALAPNLSIPFKADHVLKRTGVDVSEEETHKILKNIGFSFPEKATVRPPAWRPDITQSVDVVEEVIRLYGYDALPEITLSSEPQKTLSSSQAAQSLIRHLLAARTFMEVITWSMVSEKEFHLFGGKGTEAQISNPITVDLEYLRPSVLIHLLKSVQQNLDRGLSPLSFFEIGPRYQGVNPEDQFTSISGVRVGKEKEGHWLKQERSVDVFDIKADALSVLEVCGISLDSVQIKEGETPSWYHPGRSGWIQRGPKNKIASFGEIHPAILKEFGIKERVVAFEIDLCCLMPLKIKIKSKGPLSLSAFQKVERDFCFLFDKKLPAEKIIKTLKKVDRSVQEIQIFDIYEGKGVPDDQKSVSIHICFDPKDHTFSEEEIKTLYDRVVSIAEKDLKGALRS